MKFGSAIIGAVVLLTACSEAPSAVSGSATVFLTERPDDVAFCGNIADANDMQPGADGSIWRWAKTDEMSGLLFCRQQTSGPMSAWREVTKNDKATHSLKFGSNDSPAMFQPI